jgi:hypothetical protein
MSDRALRILRDFCGVLFAPDRGRRRRRRADPATAKWRSALSRRPPRNKFAKLNEIVVVVGRMRDNLWASAFLPGAVRADSHPLLAKTIALETTVSSRL